MLQQYDARNAGIQIFVKDQLVPRAMAKVSVFDSSVQGGDAVWEGIRVYQQGIFCLDAHLERLVHSAHAMAFAAVPTKDFIRHAIFKTLKANGMTHDAHIRLTLTRGEKITSGMDPRLNTNGCTLIVLAEWKPPVYDNANGIRIVTSAIRRNSPAFVDSKIHHNNLINNILAKIQANVAGADDALMLDQSGFVAELNGTNIFMVKNGVVLTPHADACLPGITRGLVIGLCQEHRIPCIEKNLSLTDFYTADEVFCSGTMGELTPIVAIDGRSITGLPDWVMLPKLVQLFRALRSGLCTPIV